MMGMCSSVKSEDFIVTDVATDENNILHVTFDAFHSCKTARNDSPATMTFLLLIGGCFWVTFCYGEVQRPGKQVDR